MFDVAIYQFLNRGLVAKHVDLKTYVDTDESQQKTASEKLARILSR